MTPCFQRHLALSVSGSCRTGVSWVGHKAHPRGVRTMAVEPCRGPPAQSRSPRGRHQHDLRRYALSAMLGIVTEEDTDGEFASDKPNRLQRQNSAVNAPQRGKTVQDDQASKKYFTRLQSNVRRTFKIASPGWNFISNRIGSGTGCQTLHN